MGTFFEMAVHPTSSNPWEAPYRRSGALKRDALNVALFHQYTTDPFVLDEADWVYLQALVYAEQIHPWTVDQVSELGGIESRNAKRWTMEGPISPVAGEPANCTQLLQVAYNLTASPGSDWRTFQPDKYKLRSVKLRLTITRPSTDFDFRVYRLAIRATRVAPPQRDIIGERFYSRG